MKKYACISNSRKCLVVRMGVCTSVSSVVLCNFKGSRLNTLQQFITQKNEPLQ